MLVIIVSNGKKHHTSDLNWSISTLKRRLKIFGIRRNCPNVTDEEASNCITYWGLQPSFILIGKTMSERNTQAW